MEGLESLWIGSHSLTVGSLCDPCLLALDLDRRCNRCREPCAKLGFRDARRCVLRNFRNGCGNGRGLHTGKASAVREALFDGEKRKSFTSTKLLWEELDAKTRQRCETAIEAKLPRGSLLLGILADALRTHAHSFARGAPPSLLRDYARSVDLVWDKLGVTKGRRRFDPGVNKSQLSAFAKFANEALAAVGIESRVSDRQIRQAIRERKKRPS
jgi:hypothetical protein